MKTIFGIFFIVLGTILLFGGIYTGLWVMLISGIVNLIEQIRAVNCDSMIIAMSIVKILFFEVPIAFGVWFGLLSIGAGIKLTLSYRDYFR